MSKLCYKIVYITSQILLNSAPMIDTLPALLYLKIRLFCQS